MVNVKFNMSMSSLMNDYLKRIVSARIVGFVNLAKTIPAIQA